MKKLLIIFLIFFPSSTWAFWVVGSGLTKCDRFLKDKEERAAVKKLSSGGKDEEGKKQQAISSLTWERVWDKQQKKYKVVWDAAAVTRVGDEVFGKMKTLSRFMMISYI